MFHGNFQVVRHAGRQAGRFRVSAQHPLVLRGKPRKRLPGVTIERRNTHQPDQRQRSRGGHLVAQLVNQLRTAGVHTAARGVVIEADLHIHLKQLVSSTRIEFRGDGAVQRGDQARAVDRMSGVGPPRK
jgi:hypothetical protein